MYHKSETNYASNKCVMRETQHFQMTILINCLQVGRHNKVTLPLSSSLCKDTKKAQKQKQNKTKHLNLEKKTAYVFSVFS